MEEEVGRMGPLDGPKKPCGGLKPSCLGCDPDDGLAEPDGAKYPDKGE